MSANETAARKSFKIMHGDALMNIEFESVIQPVHNLIVEGLTLLCGASKIGKSWFMLDMCCAVASGRPFLGRETLQGDVLYLALEDSDRRVQERLKKLGECPTSDFAYAIEALPLDAGLLEQMEDWVQHVEKPRMIVIDTLQKVRGPAPNRANAYAVDYEAMGRLKRFADKWHIALVLVHHLNKTKDAADPFDKISGSTGLMGAADTSILIDRERGSENAKLSFTGRDVWGDDLTLRMANGRWSVIGHEQLEREAYESNYIVRTVKNLLSSAFGGVVNITSEAFRDAIAETCGNCPYGTLDAASKAVTAVAPNLLRFDGINTEKPRIGTKRGFRFAKSHVMEV